LFINETGEIFGSCCFSWKSRQNLRKQLLWSGTSQNKKQIWSFLGFCSYYRKFIKDFFLVVKSLYVLTENQIKFIWTKQCQEAFDKLKQTLTATTLLFSFKRRKIYTWYGYVRSRNWCSVVPEIERNREGYFSRVLNKAKKNYCVTHKRFK